MRSKRQPAPSDLLLDRFVSYGRRAPDGIEAVSVPFLIRMLRTSLRMSQAQLAKRAGLPQSHIAVIEAGKVDLKLATVRKIFKAMQGELVVAVRFRKSPDLIVAERIREIARRHGASAADEESGRRRRKTPSRIWDENRGCSTTSGSLTGASIVRDRASVRIVEKEDPCDDLRYWLGKTPAERVDAVEFLREQFYALKGHRTIPGMAHSLQVLDRRE